MIPVAEPLIGEKELKYITEAIKSGWISSGKYISMFEEKFSKFCGVKYGISCNSGTSALHLALVALGIREGDEVIIPTFTYISTANVVKYVNATPIFVDSSRETWNIDPKKIEEKITEKTKAIIPVHLYGLPCEMEKIMEIAKKYNLYIIEDAAEAHGAEYKGKKVGSFGDIGCFSFFGNKIITTGEGGMCVTNNLELKEKLESLRNQGMSKERRYWHPIVGFNYRMSNIHAAIGLAQLEGINDSINLKIRNAELYSERLKDIVELPPNIKDTKNIYWMFCILSDKKDEIIKALKEKEIETRPLFSPIHKMPPYYIGEKYPIAKELNKKGINLPSSIKLKEEEIKRICEIIKAVVKK